MTEEQSKAILKKRIENALTVFLASGGKIENVATAKKRPQKQPAKQPAKYDVPVTWWPELMGGADSRGDSV